MEAGAHLAELALSHEAVDGEVLERHVDLSLLPAQLVALLRHEGRHDARRSRGTLDSGVRVHS